MKKDVISTHQLNALHALLPLLGDLAVELPAEQRYYRVLGALRELVPSDALALLRLEQGELVPVAA
ncbi:nitric oxide reductase transcriptional regulator NorR, partial [Pseudomonas syringae pv. actinidiae]|nr:nitric oxide reductase transcriptional regulator NorR [Pseudomonas syringae pv. actinidiae]